MNPDSLDLDCNVEELQKNAYQKLGQGEYPQAINLYGQLISLDPNDRHNYFYLGLSQLLIGDLVGAANTWQIVIEKEDDLDRVEAITTELCQLLDREATRQAEKDNYDLALLIRHTLNDINPYYLSNLLSIALSLLSQQKLTNAKLAELEIIPLLESEFFIPLATQTLSDFLFQTLQQYNDNAAIIQLVEQVCLAHPQHQVLIREKFLGIIRSLSSNPNQVITVTAMGNRLYPEDKEFYILLIVTYIKEINYADALTIAKKFYDLSHTQNTVTKVIACHYLIGSLSHYCQSWSESDDLNRELELHLSNLGKDDISQLSATEVTAICAMRIGFYAPFFGDNPQKDHTLRKSFHSYISERISDKNRESIENYRKRLIIRKQSFMPGRPLRIGYISECLRTHSVGFLARWLIQYHDRNNFLLYGYMGDRFPNDPLRSWYIAQFHKSDSSNLLNTDAHQIIDDGVDILIDLDSITGCIRSLVFKPAPIQVSWLGWDANSLSSIDYFIADPYVLPDRAQEYYTEKIWRLPRTFIAVDGFESATPKLRRDILDIPQDAIIYLSAQSASKRHPDNIQQQLQIIKQVPNSYLLLKSVNAEQDSLKAFFYEIADIVGVSKNRLRFLTFTSTSEEHRADLMIADVILDTYPYNGATHTLETLWMGVPIVTRVGEQFASRNSYTMMVNAGISEGIAWTDAEYVEWGVRLGTDSELRQQVILKLRQSRQTAPLWNSRQFAKDMEDAYQQMWEIYLQSEDLLDVDRDKDRELFKAEAKIKNQDALWFAQNDKIESAIACWQTAVDWDPNYIDAHYNLGTAYSQIQNYELAIHHFQTAISLKPDYAEALYNSGITLVKLNDLEGAISYYQQALAIAPTDIEIHLALGNTYFKQKEFAKSLSIYELALEISPRSAPVLGAIGVALSEIGQVNKAIYYLEAAISIDPNDAQSYSNLGCAFMLAKKLDEAVFCYRKSLELDPNLADSYWNFNNHILSFPSNPLYFNFPLRRQLADQFLETCYKSDRIRSSITYFTNYIHSGLVDEVKSEINELEKYIYSNTHLLSNEEIQIIYSVFLFEVSNARDNIALNSNISKFSGSMFKEKVIELTKSRSLWQSDRPPFPQIYNISQALRIGIISPHFSLHSVGICSIDVIRALSKITPHIYLYNTGVGKADSLTLEFEHVAENFYSYARELEIPELSSYDSRLNRISSDILNDKVDVLLDLDSITHPFNTHLLSRNLAPVCVSWLGFDAPFISSNNYWLGDRYTHPYNVDEYYVEKLIRLPHSHIAVSGFESIIIDRDLERDKLGITPESVAYLCSAPGRKFNRDLVKASVRILQSVPNSVLLIKIFADNDVIHSAYFQECNQKEVSCDRLKFLPSYKTAEEHRSTYQLADVFLDTYPYNGGTHNLEALWANLPVITRTGEQSFARMGYSFLQSVGIDTGIAHTWEEYVEWGIKYGLDTNLRNSIKEKLILGKQLDTLAPLWNPQALAKSMYQIFQELLLSKEIDNVNTG